MSVEALQPSNAKNIALGVGQILLWGGSYFILSILAEPIMQETGWSYQGVYGALSLALLLSGLLLPRIGWIIGANEKQVVLPYAGVVMAGGLIVMGAAEQFGWFLLGWAILGLAMGMGLYDSLFASLGKHYGKATSKVLVQVTLVSSLAPTISWFLVSQLLSRYGWRTACFIYAGILVVTILPLHRYALPQAARTAAPPPAPEPTQAVARPPFHSRIYYLLLANFTIGAVLTTAIVIHLIDILLAKGMARASVVGAVAFLGPSQAGVRVVELLFARNEPVKTALLAAVVTLLGIALLVLPAQGAILAIILFGMGNGLRSILRGTLPLAIFGQQQYAVVVGKLARLPLIAQALTPFGASWLIQHGSVAAFLYGCCGLAFLNILLCLLIPKVWPGQPAEPNGRSVALATSR